MIINFRQKGFTLIEIMVVMAVIAILAALVIGGITIARKMSVEARHREDARTITIGLEAYYSKNKTWCPPEASGGSTYMFYSPVFQQANYTNINLTSTNDCPGSWMEGGGYVTLDCFGDNQGYSIVPANFDCSDEMWDSAYFYPE